MRTIIIDALNVLFIRNYIVNSSLSTKGYPIGGIVGAFKSLQKLCNEAKPDRIIICWDGGSKKRKQMNANYKNGRKPIRLNRSIKTMSETEELNNKIWQQTKLFECLNCLPIIQFLFDDVEADDIIACICNLLPRSDEKIIISSDKDFLQLCDNDNTVLYRPVQDEILTKDNISEIYGVHPENMCLARAIEGDKSDNLPGVKGIALKGINKNLPFLKESQVCNIPDLLRYCQGKLKDSKLKFFEKILDSREIIESNYKLMQLKIPNLSVDNKRKIEYTLNNVELEFNKTELNSLMIKDGWGVYNWKPLFQKMSKIMKEQGLKK